MRVWKKGVDMFKKLIFLFFVFTLFAQSQQDIEVLYNAAVEKYIKNDYDKAIEYMEKVYSTSPQEKYKNFLVRILYEAANKSYLTQNYKKAYEYTTKALKYTPADPKILELHNIIADILEKDKLVLQKKENQQEVFQPQTKQIQLSKQPQIVTKKKPQATQSELENFQPQVTIYYEDKKFKVLFYIMLSIFFVSSIIYTISQIKLQRKIKNQLQKQIFELQQENSSLKLQLSETKTELEKAKEREQMYKKYLEDYKKDTKEKLEIITQLQNQIVALSKERQTSINLQLPKVSQTPSFNFQQKELEEILKTSPKITAETEQELEVYKEKLAVMLKILYETNPKKALGVIHDMVNSQNPFARINIAYSLVEIGTDETISFLIKLYEDADVRVKRETLRQLARLKQKIQNKEVSLTEELEEKVIAIIKQERQKGEWIF